jgi:hypothetical protein
VRSLVFFYAAMLILVNFFAVEASARTFYIPVFGDSITQGKKRDSDGNITGILVPPNGERTSDDMSRTWKMISQRNPNILPMSAIGIRRWKDV